MSSLRLFILSVLLLFGQLTQAQTTRYVSTTGTNSNPATATSWVTSTTNLQGAINASASGDEVWVARGTYTPTQDINGGTGTAQTRTFRIRNNVKVYGGFDGYESSINDPNRAFGTPVGRSSSVLSGGGQSYHVVSFSQVSNCRLDGFTIRSGNASGTGVDSRGGGIYNNGSGTVGLGGSSTPNLANCFIEGNQATGEGAGMYNDGQTLGTASPYLTNCTFFDNTATGNGGAVTNVGSNSGSASPEFINCLFVQNTANSGGAVYNVALRGEVSPDFTDCSFSRNNATGSNIGLFPFDRDGVGGGMFTECRPGNAIINLERCRFESNTAFFGGGFMNLGLRETSSSSAGISMYLRNAVITKNLDNSSDSGTNTGVIYNCAEDGGANLYLSNCTVFGNTSINNTNPFYPIFFDNRGPAGSAVVVTNSVLWDNGPNPGIHPFGASRDFTINYSNVQYGTFGGAGNVRIDPGFTSGSLSLTTGSPLIDAGDPASTTFMVGATDLAGSPRVVGCAVDMGAYENQSSTGQRLAITGGPAAVSVVCPGNSVSVPVSYSGTASGFQWYKDNLATPVASQTTAILSIPSPTVADAGNYSLVITGACNSVTSTAFSLSLTNPPTRLYVNASAVGQNTGLSWPNAFTSLQSALNYPCSQSVTEIWVAAGVYKPTSTTSRSANFTLNSNVAVYGGFVGSETALSGRPALNPVTGQPSSSTLSGEIGDPASTTDNTLHVLITDNAPVLDGFVITGARAEGPGPVEGFGGGIFALGTPQIRNCLFTGNYSFYNGAGVYVSSGTPSFTDCVFRSNNARRWGGGISNEEGGIVVNRCLFEDNIGIFGGAVDNSATATLTNCVFRQNQARESGGAIANRTSNVTITNCTFLSNTALGQASGIPAGGAIATSGNAGPNIVTVKNTIFWDNGGNITIANFNNPALTATYCLFQSSVTGLVGSPTNLITNTSPFTSPGSFSLSTSCSPAIDAGDPATTSATVGISDLIGSARFSGSGRVDIGAVEFQGTSPFVSIVSGPATQSVVCAGGGVSVPVQVDGVVQTLRWYNAGGQVSGQNTATLNLNNLPAGTGSYSLVATGNCNSVTSAAFNLTVNQAPTASNVSLPASASVACEGGSVQVMALVNGNVTNFQWYQNGQSIGGQGSPTLMLANVQLTQSGFYTLVVGNSCGNFAVSPAFSLTVNPSPTITTSITGTTFVASDGTVNAGTTYSFFVVIDRINNYEIRAGEENRSGRFPIPQPGPYVLVVTNSSGCSRRLTGTIP